MNDPARTKLPCRPCGAELSHTLGIARCKAIRRRKSCQPGHRGFNLIELMIVLAVTTVLTALLLPALSKLHENVNIVRCQSNLKQIGTGMFMYTEDWRGQMPPTVKLHPNPKVPIQPQELMASYHIDSPVPSHDSPTDHPNGPVARSGPMTSTILPPLPEHLHGWDGLGLLYALEYCRAIDCYYCPSHRGDHPIERYAEEWRSPGKESIYINYHYAGHIDWDTRRRRIFQFRPDFIVASDGLRTVSDFNHGSGMNMLFGDASVEYSSSALVIYHMLPEGELLPGEYQEELYKNIWFELDRSKMGLPPSGDGPDGGH